MKDLTKTIFRIVIALLVTVLTTNAVALSSQMDSIWTDSIRAPRIVRTMKPMNAVALSSQKDSIRTDSIRAPRIVLNMKPLKAPMRFVGDTLSYKFPGLIVAVATRSRTDEYQVPAAISSVQEHDYKYSRRYGLDDALSAVPGALVQSRSGNQDVRISIRGFGSRGAGERSNAATTRGIRFLLNGLPITEPDGRTSLDLVDMSAITSIEVVRSNTSALWGNAAGGVVSMSTLPVQPGTSMEAGTTFGSFGFNKSSLLYRSYEYATKAYAITSNTNFDGWRDHSQSTLFQSMAGIESLIGSGTLLTVHAAAASNLFRIPGPLTQEQFDLNPKQAQADSTVYSPTYTARDERRFNRIGRISASLEQTMAEGKILSLSLFAEPKYLQRSERNTFRDFTRYHVGGSATYTHDANITSDIQSNLLVGLDNTMQDGAILFYSLDPATSSRGSTLRENKKEGANALGLFAQEMLTINEKFIVLAGLRSDNITYSYASYINPTLNESRTFSQLSPKLGFTYKMAFNMSAYGNLAYGVEIPAGNEIDPPAVLGEDTLRPINSLLEPIRSRTIEAGFKYTGYVLSELVSVLSVNLAAYSITTENDLIPYRGGRFYTSAGQTRRNGLEAGGSIYLTNGFRATVSASVSSNTLNAYRFDSVYVNTALAGRSLDLSGNTMPGVPSWFTTLRLTYEPPALRRLRIESEIRSVGSMFANDVNTVSSPSYTVVDASAGYQFDLFANVSMRVFARMNNLLNEKFIGNVWLNPDMSLVSKSPVYIDPGLPRNWTTGVNITYSL